MRLRYVAHVYRGLDILAYSFYRRNFVYLPYKRRCCKNLFYSFYICGSGTLLFHYWKIHCIFFGKNYIFGTVLTLLVDLYYNISCKAYWVLAFKIYLFFCKHHSFTFSKSFKKVPYSQIFKKTYVTHINAIKKRIFYI